MRVKNILNMKNLIFLKKKYLKYSEILYKTQSTQKYCFKTEAIQT